MKIVITSVLVDDQDKALAFYRDVLGFILKHDIPMGGDARWLTLTSPGDADGVELLLDGGDGVRLQAWHSSPQGAPAKALALLLHGWEGSAESSYMRMTTARLLEQGFDVVRLNFRDHGNTHHLNPGIFHSCLLDEVLRAIGDLSRRVPDRDPA